MVAAPTPLTLQTLNALDDAAFQDSLKGVFEHSPWVVARTQGARPFASVEALHQALCTTFLQAGEDERLALVRAHPELAGREAHNGSLTVESAREQRGAGLDQCTPAELARLHQLNAAYREKFGFPFVLAVRGRGREEVIALMAQRLQRSRAEELAQALQEICHITRFRLDALFAPRAH